MSPGEDKRAAGRDDMLGALTIVAAMFATLGVGLVAIADPWRAAGLVGYGALAGFAVAAWRHRRAMAAARGASDAEAESLRSQVKVYSATIASLSMELNKPRCRACARHLAVAEAIVAIPIPGFASDFSAIVCECCARLATGSEDGRHRVADAVLRVTGPVRHDS